MNAADDVKATIASILKVAPDQLKSETQLSELGADSLDMIEMVFMFEERFNIDMVFEAKESTFAVKLKNSDGVDHEVEINTVGDIIRTVQQIIDAKVG
jgi:acyl carrier protein